MNRAQLIRYDISAGVWNEAKTTPYEWVEDAMQAAAAEAQAPMQWADTQIGYQGSIEELEYDDWKHIWEITGLEQDGTFREVLDEDHKEQ